MLERVARAQKQQRTKAPYSSPGAIHDQFAADVPAPQAARMAATQRTVTQEARPEPSGETPRMELPSWFLPEWSSRHR
jgi:hypothetical protein